MDIQWRVRTAAMQSAELPGVWLEVSHERVGSVGGLRPPGNDGVWRWRAHGKDPFPGLGGTVLELGEGKTCELAAQAAEAWAQSNRGRCMRRS